MADEQEPDKKGGDGITANGDVSIGGGSGQIAIGEYITQIKVENLSGEELDKLIDYVNKKKKGSAKSELSSEGELPCIIVYSEKKHVEYIYPILSQIEFLLRKRGYKPQKLGDEVRSSEDYLAKLEMLIENCVLGVVILDGFRPNVLFEFGFLKGKKKPVILLQSDDGMINVQTLYRTFKESGLSEKSYGNLKNPKIELGFHFSDFGGKHIAFIDWKAMENDIKHPSVVLEKELNKNKDLIVEEFKNIKIKKISL